MSQFLDLPTPLPAATLNLGQLLSNPLDSSLLSLQPTQEIPTTHSNINDTNESRISQTTIQNPLNVFNTLRRDSTTQSFLRKSAYQNQPIYFVTGLQMLSTPVAKPSTVDANDSAPQYRLPVRRVDSASNLESTSTSINNNEKTSHGSIVAVELREVKCRIGAPSEPHCIADVEYDWSYYRLEGEDVQLSVGLGGVARAGDLKTLAGVGREERRGEGREWRRGPVEVEGFGGF